MDHIEADVASGAQRRRDHQDPHRQCAVASRKCQGDHAQSGADHADRVEQLPRGRRGGDASRAQVVRRHAHGVTHEEHGQVGEGGKDPVLFNAM